MTVLSVDEFRGLSILATPAKRPPGSASVVNDAVLRGGGLLPLKGVGPSVSTSKTSFLTLYRYEVSGVYRWLGWNQVVKPVLGPLADDAYDRLYWSGHTYPRMAARSELQTDITNLNVPIGYRLGVPSPDSAPVVLAPGETNQAATDIWGDHNTIWVADQESARLFAYRRNSWQREPDKDFMTLPLEGNHAPVGIWSDGTTMWVADEADDKVYAYDMDTKQRDSTKDFNTLKAAGNRTPISMWSDGTTMWIGDRSDDKLYAYVLATKARDATKDISLFSENTGPRGIWSDGTTMYVSDGPGSRVYAYVLATGNRTPEKEFPTDSSTIGDDADEDETVPTSLHSPWGIWGAGGLLYVADAGYVRPEDNGLTAFRLSTGQWSQGQSAPRLVDPLNVLDMAWVYTLVTQFGEEGPPSPPSNLVAIRDGTEVEITIPTPSGLTGRAFGTGAKKRVYRANAGTTSPVYQYVGEADWADTTFRDGRRRYQLGEALPSIEWSGPPDDDSTLYPGGQLEGLVSLPNGILTGFSGRGVWFSEPYLPHAWPVRYRVGLDRPVIAVAPVTPGVVALTDGHPYLITGARPGQFVARKIEFPQGCVNEHSVVDMGGYIIYATPDGLARCDGTQAELVTAPIMRPDQWRDRYNSGKNIRAAFWEGRYVAMTQSGATDKCFIYDPLSDTFSEIDNLRFDARFTDTADGTLYVRDGTAIKKFDAGDNLNTSWRSNEMRLSTLTAFSHVMVSIDMDDDPTGWDVTVKLHVDGTTQPVRWRYDATNGILIKYGTDASQQFIGGGGPGKPPLLAPLPSLSGYIWSVEIACNVRVRGVWLSDDVFELAQVQAQQEG